MQRLKRQTAEEGVHIENRVFLHLEQATITFVRSDNPRFQYPRFVPSTCLQKVSRNSLTRAVSTHIILQYSCNMRCAGKGGKRLMHASPEHLYGSLAVHGARIFLPSSSTRPDGARYFATITTILAQTAVNGRATLLQGDSAPINVLHQLSYLRNGIFAREKKLEYLIS